MVSLLVVLYVLITLFSVIGFMRGWASEALVSFSVVLAMFLINLLEDVLPVTSSVIADQTVMQFWIRTIILSTLVFFGYQTPRISRLTGTARKDRISDALLGLFMGAINGFLIFGTLWYYMHYAGYPFKYISAPSETDEFGQAALAMINRLPPHWMGSGYSIFMAVGLAFLFVLVVFI